MKIKIFISLALLLAGISVRSQIAVTTDGSAPAASAMLDVKSTTKGLLVPRMTKAQREAIVSPATGLLVFQTNEPSGHYHYNGSAWKQEVDMFSSGVIPSANTLLTFDGTNWVAKSLALSQAGGNTPINNMQPYLAMNYCIALWGIYPSPSGADPFIGEVALFAFGYAPNGWAVCNGQLLPISQNTALFSLIGTYYGGNGVTTFALPDLRGRIAINQGTGPGLSTKYIGEYGGSESVILNVSQMPQHSHTVTYQ
jgi:microcystin-dependent protein